MQYRLTYNSMMIYRKNTMLSEDGSIYRINWSAKRNCKWSDGILFTEEEKEYMLKHYRFVGVYEIYEV